MRFALIYIFDADKKRNKFMENADVHLESPDHDKTYQLKLKGIEGWQVYQLLDILTNFPNDPQGNYSKKELAS